MQKQTFIGEVGSMNKVILDANLRSKLRDLSEPLEICDETGRVLARLTPLPDPFRWQPVTSDVSDSELERRSSSGEKRYTTAEVKKHLENL